MWTKTQKPLSSLSELPLLPGLSPLPVPILPLDGRSRKGLIAAIITVLAIPLKIR